MIKKKASWILGICNLRNIQNSNLIKITIDLNYQRGFPILPRSNTRRFKLKAIFCLNLIINFQINTMLFKFLFDPFLTFG